jgi:hypothetical protein
MIIGTYELVQARAGSGWLIGGLFLAGGDIFLWAFPVRCHGANGNEREEPQLTPEPEPRWEAPSPYNYSGALDAMGTIAAPLLASVSIALVVVVLTSPTAFHALNLTVLLLLVAAAGFVAALECSFQARQFAVTPADLEGWWPDNSDRPRRERLRQIQREHLACFRRWAVRARCAYNVGILALIAGVGALLWPASLSHVAPLRICVLGLLAVSAVIEAIWIARTLMYEDRPRLPAVGPETPEID